jgi:rhamnosyltransferase
MAGRGKLDTAAQEALASTANLASHEVCPRPRGTVALSPQAVQANRALVGKKRYHSCWLKCKDRMNMAAECVISERIETVEADLPPHIAVCLAAYNGMAYIDEQITSILDQRHVRVQIFISVDKSTDGTEAWLAARARTEPRLTVLPFGQRFGGAGPNFYRLLSDVELTGFDYLSLADQDDLWHPEKLWRAHCKIVAEKALGYSSNVTAFWPSGRTQLVDKAQPQRAWDFLFEASGPGCTYVLHRSLAQALQALVRADRESFRRAGYHDWLIYAFARANGHKWVIDDWSSLQYRQHANNQLGVNSGLRSYLKRCRVMLSGYFFDQALLIARLVHTRSAPVLEKGLQSGRRGYLWLATRATQCRRKPADQIMFAFLCVLIALNSRHDKGST